MVQHQLKDIRIQGWESQKSDVVFRLNDGHIDQMKSLLREWRSVFPHENTWVQINYHVPSIIIRLDCVIHDNKVYIYEIEERPAGIGLSSLVNPCFARELCELKKRWPEFKVVLSRNRSSHDDTLWLDKVNGDGYQGLVLVRAEPDEYDYHHFSSDAVSTLKTKGNKGYGVALRLWREISFNDMENLPWDDGFVLKPLRGSKCRDIIIWPKRGRIEVEGGSLNMRKKLMGCATRSKIVNTLQRHSSMFMQPFIPSMICPGLRNYLMIYRFYFGYDPSIDRYIPINGVWNARPKQQKIHGASDAVFGSLNLE